MSRQSPEILKVNTLEELEKLGNRYGSYKLNAYQILGVDSGLLNSSSVFNQCVAQLHTKIDENKNLESNIKRMIHMFIEDLATMLKNPEQKNAYDIEFNRVQASSPTPTEPAALSEPSTPSRSTPKTKRGKREGEQLLGSSREEHCITFEDFLRGEQLPVLSSQFTVEDLSNIKLLRSQKDNGMNALDLLTAIQDKIGQSHLVKRAIKQACASLGINRQNVNSEKQTLWVLLKCEKEGKASKGLQEAIQGAKAECMARREERGLHR